VLRDDYLQIDENTLAAISSFQISKQILEEIHDFIEQALSLKGYRIFEKIDNYIFFPDVGYSWSHYQLRAFIQKFFSGSFTVITNRLIHKIGSDIIVNSSLGINNYDDFIKHLIRQEHKQQPFHDVTTLVQWLINEGLVPLKALITIKASGLFEQETHVVNESTMKYLLRDNFISFDNSGKLIIQGGW
jgi:hypothetical protein